MGFCDLQFPLEGQMPGFKPNSNSIGIAFKHVMDIDGSLVRFGNHVNYHFEKGDFIGIGIIHRPNVKMECFSTCNGKFLGKTSYIFKKMIKKA